MEKTKKELNMNALLDDKHFKAVRFKKDNNIAFKKANPFDFVFKIILSFFTRQDDILFRLGSHIFTGLPGSGKTLLANWVKEHIDYSKYFLISNIKEFEGIPQFKIEEVFDEKDQVKKFPIYDENGRKLYGIVFDEVNLNFNRRDNKTSGYNNLFIGLIKFLVTHRHQGVPRIYFIGQKLELQDTQLQSLFKYQHNIIHKTERFRYWDYCLNNSHVRKIPVKIYLDNYVKVIAEDGDTFEYLGITKYVIEPRVLLTYDTYALAKDFETKPETTLY